MLDVDPRPDLKSDSKLWTKLLQLAKEMDPDLAGVLHGFRCEGTRIKKGIKGYALRPDIDPAGKLAWESRKEYSVTSNKWLRPHQKEIVDLLKKLWGENKCSLNKKL